VRCDLEAAIPLEFVQIGNCGSPIELDEGWLLLTHGVGPIRKYSIGAVLLDKRDPSRVLARSREPLVRPEPSEREDTFQRRLHCGAMRHNDQIVLPYASPTPTPNSHNQDCRADPELRTLKLFSQPRRRMSGPERPPLKKTIGFDHAMIEAIEKCGRVRSRFRTHRKRSAARTDRPRGGLRQRGAARTAGNGGRSLRAGGEMIDWLRDRSAPPEEQAQRKRRLIKAV